MTLHVPRIRVARLSSGHYGHDESIKLDNHKNHHDELPVKPRARLGSYASSVATSVSSEDGDDTVSIPSVQEQASSRHTDKSQSRNAVLEDMISQLSEDEKETAARSSYAYFTLSKAATASLESSTSDLSVHELNEARDAAAVAMASRHLNAEDGNADLALETMHATIQWRREKHIDELRDCFSIPENEQTPIHKGFQQQIRHFVGPKGKLFIRGYDNDSRACWHTVGRHSPEGSQNDHEGCMVSHYYMLERSLACSEAKSLQNGSGAAQEMVVVSVDFAGFSKKHAPPLHTVKELLFNLRDHYPERLFRVYLVDGPFLFRSLWSMIKPFMDPKTKLKFQMVTGAAQRRQVFGDAMGADQCMSYQHPEGELAEGVDMDAFYYQTPFDKAIHEQCVDDETAEYVL